MNQQRKALWWLANAITQYGTKHADRIGVDSRHYLYQDELPISDVQRDAIREKILYSPVLMQGSSDLADDLHGNPAVVEALLFAAQPLGSENHKKLYEALLSAGITRTAANWVRPPRMLNPIFPLLEQLDTLANRLTDPPCQETGRTVLDALIDALRAIAPGPRKPSRVDDRRFKACELGVKREKIAEQEGVSERAVDASLTRVRDWREYHGIANGAKGRRGKKRALSYANEPHVQPAKVTASATVKTTK